MFIVCAANDGNQTIILPTHFLNKLIAIYSYCPVAGTKNPADISGVSISILLKLLVYFSASKYLCAAFCFHSLVFANEEFHITYIAA